MVRKILPALLALAGLVLAGCGDYGKVEQGRTVAFNKDTRIVTIVKDAGIDDRNPHYTVLPVHEFKLPDDPAECGALPDVGLRMNLNVEKKTITMYNPQTKAFEELKIEVVANHTDVDVDRRHPLVFDANTRKPIAFPKIDNTKRTVEIYSRRQKLLTTVKVAEEDFSRYKEKDWNAGDDVRIYYKDPAKALRFMNINKTNINRR